jgi:hypothetical protein
VLVVLEPQQLMGQLVGKAAIPHLAQLRQQVAVAAHLELLLLVAMVALVAVERSVIVPLVATELLDKAITAVQQLPVAAVMLVAVVEELEPQVQQHQRVILVVLEVLAFHQALAGHLRFTLVVAAAAEIQRVLLVGMVVVVLAAVQPIQGLLALPILVAAAVAMGMVILGKLVDQVW